MPPLMSSVVRIPKHLGICKLLKQTSLANSESRSEHTYQFHSGMRMALVSYC